MTSMRKKRRERMQTAKLINQEKAKNVPARFFIYFSDHFTLEDQRNKS